MDLFASVQLIINIFELLVHPFPLLIVYTTNDKKFEKLLLIHATITLNRLTITVDKYYV